MNSPSNAGKEHNPHGLPEMEQFRFLCIGERVQKGDEFWHPGAKKWIESWDHIRADLWPISEIDFTYRRRTTPPTQSQEGETEVDTAHKQFHAQDEYAHHPGVSLEFARNLHSRLTAAQRENDRLRSEVALIEWQNQEKLTVTWNHLHGAFIVQGVNQVCGNMGRGPTVIEALRAARAATEEGKRG